MMWVMAPYHILPSIYDCIKLIEGSYQARKFREMFIHDMTLLHFNFSIHAKFPPY